MDEQNKDAAPATPAPAADKAEDKESIGDKLKDVAGDIKEKGEELIDKVKDKLDHDKGDEKKA